MIRIKPIVIALLVMVALAGFMPQQSLANWEKVDPRLLRALETEEVVTFHIIMTEQADLSGAASLATKVERTTYVFERLVETAARTQQGILQHLTAEGVTYQPYYIYNVIEATGGRTVLEWLAARPDVARIVTPPNPQLEPVYHDLTDQEVTVLDPNTARGEAIEWNVTRIGAPTVWAMGFNGEGMVVGDNDTGVQYDHPALVNKYRGNLGGGVFDHNYNWWDAWGGAPSPTPVDYDGHGTHTMGTMVGDDGGSNQIGVAPGAQWVACAGLNVECLQFFLAPWDLSGANPDPTMAPDSINNSWYDPSGYDYRPIIVNLNAAGIAVIKSAGNNGPSCTSISNPGYVPEIIATAAFAQGDTIASFSSRGPTSNYGDTILKPEVAAPGVNVRSSVPGGGYEGGWSGTSMAAPHTTALVALIWQAAPCLMGDVPTTKDIMMWTAEPKIDAQCTPFVDHPNDVWGWGILDAEAAVNMAIAYCGGLGTLNGTVTNTSVAPIEGAEVVAEGAINFTTYTDATGYYVRAVPSDTYTVTASAFGYYPVSVADIVVTEGMTTTQDFVLAPLTTYIISGYVTELGSGMPLLAEVTVLDTPLAPVTTDPADGYYEIEVPEGTYTFSASAASHLTQQQVVVVDMNKTVDFELETLPCILLVDDDQNGPDVQAAYTTVLDNLGLDYAVWDTSTDGDPTADDLIGYTMVLWFNGYPFSSTFTSANETAASAYLDAGGNFFLSAQDYLYDMGLTSFGQNYLKIASFTSDVSQITVTGQNVFAGLGPYSLSYPFTNYSDTVNPASGGLVSFLGNVGNAAVSYDAPGFNTVFLGYPLEAVPLAGREAIVSALVDFFGGCVVCDQTYITDLESNSPVYIGETMYFTATVWGAEPITYTWDFDGTGTPGGSGANVSFLYDTVGQYTVTLEVNNACLVPDTNTLLVDVLEIPGNLFTFLPVVQKGQ